MLESHSGRNLSIILRGLVELGYCVAWRVFDSQFDGVAQRRQRVFIVASLGNGSCAEVLFERESGAGDHPPSREAGACVTALTANGVGTCGADDNQAQGGHLIASIAGTLRSSGDAHSGFEFADGLIPIEAYQCHGSNVGPMGTLRAGNGNETGGVPFAIAFTERTRAEGRNLETQDELAYALTNPGSGGRTHSRQIAGSFGVRRLTPKECERLQGYPDGWTERSDDGLLISDSARYRMLGNAVCLPTVEWIARRLMALNS
jgi:DNA (cytosine-5)-methyltransferase 1